MWEFNISLENPEFGSQNLHILRTNSLYVNIQICEMILGLSSNLEDEEENQTHI